MMSPLVSVYIPSHNRSALLVKAINSVINQTYSNIEIIVCDDGSSDATEIVVKELIDTHYGNKKIIYLRNEQPRGACFSRNRCLEVAEGEFITGLDDDDEFSSNRIELFVKYALTHNNNFLTSGLVFFNGNYYKRDGSSEQDITLDDMGYKNVIGNQVFATNKMFRDVGGFDETFPAWQDYDMWFRMVKKFGPCHRLDSATYIMNVNSERVRITTGGNAHKGYLKFIAKHGSDLTTNQLKSLYLRDIINRNESISFRELNKFLSFSTILEVSKYILRKKIGHLDRVIARLRASKSL